jgi:hypothetical protein
MVSGRGRVVSTRERVVSRGGRVESGRVLGDTGRGVTAGAIGMRCGAGTVAGGGAVVALLARSGEPGWWNSTGWRNVVATGTPRRRAGAKRSLAEPASAAESSAG